MCIANANFSELNEVVMKKRQMKSIKVVIHNSDHFFKREVYRWKAMQ